MGPNQALGAILSNSNCGVASDARKKQPSQLQSELARAEAGGRGREGVNRLIILIATPYVLAIAASVSPFARQRQIRHSVRYRLQPGEQR